MKELATDLLKELFNYRDGNLYWKVNRSNVHVGDLAGCKSATGYWHIRVNRKIYYAHRLIYLLHHGAVPEFLDHINGDKLDNRIENLRPATRAENEYNKGRRSNNTSGFKGVYWHKRDKKWHARITMNGKQKLVGLFETPEEAFAAYCKAASEVYGPFANTGEEQ